jgi:hypothetical protein
MLALMFGWICFFDALTPANRPIFLPRRVSAHTSPYPTRGASLIFDVAAASRFCCGYPLFNACCAVCKIDALGQ